MKYLLHLIPILLTILATHHEVQGAESDPYTTCAYCTKNISNGIAQYGCNHPEHALCLYETLEMQGKIENLVDLVRMPPAQNMTYRCLGCKKNCSLGSYARQRLYDDCIEIVAEAPHAMQRAFLTALPSYLAQRVMDNMNMNEQTLYIPELTPEKIWPLLKKLPISSWKSYKALLDSQHRKQLEKTIPADVIFISQDTATRIKEFKKLPLAIQEEVVIMFWPALSKEERLDYLSSIFNKQEDKNIAERAGLFAALIAHHNFASEEKIWLFSQFALQEPETITAQELIPFFSTLLSQNETYQCALAAYKKIGSSEDRTSLLGAIWQHLTDEQQKKLITILLKNPDQTFRTRNFSELIKGILAPYPVAKKIALMAKSAEEGAAFLYDIWEQLKPLQQQELASTVLSLPVTSPFEEFYTIWVLTRLPTEIAFSCLKKLLKQPLSVAQATEFVEATIGKFDEKKRYKIYTIILENEQLYLPPKKLARFLASFPRDLAFTAVKKGLKRFTNLSKAEKFLVMAAVRLTPQQRIALLNKFIKTRTLVPTDINRLIAFYGYIHATTYTDKTSLFYGFFNGLKPLFNDIFGAWTTGVESQKKCAKKLLFKLWELVPEKEQACYFSKLQPKKRSLMIKAFANNCQQYARLKRFNVLLQIDEGNGTNENDEKNSTYC